MENLFFGKSIFEAINEAKSKNLLLLISVQDNNQEESNRLNNEVWNDNQVVENLKLTCISIQLFKDTTELSQFTQFYVVPQFPAQYILNPQNGVPLKSNLGFIDANSLIKMIEESNELMKSYIPTLQPTQNNNNVNNTVNLDYNPNVNNTVDYNNYNYNDNNNNNNSYNNFDDSQPRQNLSSSNTPLDVNESKQEKALRLLKEKREKEEQERKKKLWENEQNRRESGKMMRETKDTIDKIKLESERKQRIEKREFDEKNKREVLEKINREKEIRQREYENSLSSSNNNNNNVPIPSKVSSSNITKIAIKTHLGTTIKNEFNNNSSLSEVFSFIERETGVKSGGYDVSTSYPKYTFSKQDLKKTLIELKLTPSAALICTEKSGGSSYFSSFGSSSSSSNNNNVNNSNTNNNNTNSRPSPSPSSSRSSNIFSLSNSNNNSNENGEQYTSSQPYRSSQPVQTVNSGDQKDDSFIGSIIGVFSSIYKSITKKSDNNNNNNNNNNNQPVTRNDGYESVPTTNTNETRNVNIHSLRNNRGSDNNTYW
eukprot:TRINITY_DN7710_c0_g2_i3.p1 TRINITY_DN7710_c0_g2~~TRINITY_DN7710_c0_g2_i3.p1  ORF type:complete len:541 (+),score=210.25 TRINITY_DN7710_c0_g2_i3:77-1699(+)